MNNQSNHRKAVTYIASGAGIRAAIGLLFGLMLFDNLVWGGLAGVLAGILAGWLATTQETDHDTRSTRK